MSDVLDLNAQDEIRAAAAEKAKLAMRIEKEDVMWLMSGKRGRRVVHRLLESAGVYRLSFNTNALQMAFNEGMRNQGLAMVAKLMDYCPAQYAEMLTENREGNS